MDYNARASQQFRSTAQNSRGTGQGRPKQDDSDAFMRLVPQPQFCQDTRILTSVQTDQEIAGCINDIGVPFTRDDLMKPQPQQIQKVFEWFAELLMNTTRETVEPAMRAAAEEICKEHMDIIPSDTRNLMGFYSSLRKLLVECGITDFSFSDLLRPTHDRLVKIFSYIINFVRFRETQTATMDEHFNKVEVTKTRIDTLYLENQDMEARLEEMRHERRLVESSAKEKQKRNEELKAKLLELNEGTYGTAASRGTRLTATSRTEESRRALRASQGRESPLDRRVRGTDRKIHRPPPRIRKTPALRPTVLARAAIRTLHPLGNPHTGQIPHRRPRAPHARPPDLHRHLHRPRHGRLLVHQNPLGDQHRACEGRRGIRTCREAERRVV